MNKNVSNVTPNTKNTKPINLITSQERRYTVNDTPLTHRQVNVLSEDNLVPENREGKMTWRKFNFVELVYMHLLYHLKSFGIQHETLRSFMSSYFGGFYILILNRILAGEEIILAVDSAGNCNLFTSTSYMFHRPDIPFVHIQVNNVVNSILTGLGMPESEVKWGLKQRFLDGRDIKSINEKELLNIIRGKKYREVIVKKKNGETIIVTAIRAEASDSEVAHKNLLKLAKTHGYGEITVVTRNYEIVNFVVTDTFKFDGKF